MIFQYISLETHSKRSRSFLKGQHHKNAHKNGDFMTRRKIFELKEKKNRREKMNEIRHVARHYSRFIW